MQKSPLLGLSVVSTGDEPWSDHLISATVWDPQKGVNWEPNLDENLRALIDVLTAEPETAVVVHDAPAALTALTAACIRQGIGFSLPSLILDTKVLAHHLGLPHLTPQTAAESVGIARRLLTQLPWTIAQLTVLQASWHKQASDELGWPVKALPCTPF